ncbi:MAG: O-sialoglycoprotein endopeptidase [Bacillota bacterium]|nr:O-sialoglycoprotein endopeptidase [Bacillota bacterium]
MQDGACGLRQSEAVFEHMRNLPEILEQAAEALAGDKISAVGVSDAPRPQADSYMPVFMAGLSAARSLAAMLQVPLLRFSHQEGHIAAALWSRRLEWREPFLAAHLSGGTTEILQVSPRDAGYGVELLCSSDLAAGQYIDRVGVALGLSFPAGAQLERLAAGAGGGFRLSSSVKEGMISFSGPEAAAQRAIARRVAPADIAAAVFVNIGKSLAKAVEYARQRSGCRKLVLAGGVAANQLIRPYLDDGDSYFAHPQYATDNAVGVALLTIAANQTSLDKSRDYQL